MSETTTDRKDTSQANRLYGQATTRLREKYRDEFETILDAVYAEANVVRKPRRTAEQIEADRLERQTEREAARVTRQREKALATAQALAEAYPDLIQVTAGATA